MISYVQKIAFSVRTVSKTVIKSAQKLSRKISDLATPYSYLHILLKTSQKIHIRTYIIGHYNSSVRIIDLVSHCVLISHISGGTYSLKSTPNDRFFEKLFMAILFILRNFARNLLRGSRRKNTFRISLWCLTWGSNSGFSSNKPALWKKYNIFLNLKPFLKKKRINIYT